MIRSPMMRFSSDDWRRGLKELASASFPLGLAVVTSMIVAGAGWPPLDRLAITIVGGALATGGASAISHSRNRGDESRARADQAGSVWRHASPGNALALGMALLAWSALILGVFVNWLAAGLALAGASLVWIHDAISPGRATLPRHLMAGAIGGWTALFGWAALRGELALQAFILFAILFFWRFSHSWTRAQVAILDEERDELPIKLEARYRTGLYAAQLFVISLSPCLLILLPGAPQLLGWIYVALALPLGLILLWRAAQLIRSPYPAAARSLHRYSSRYLALLLLAMILDRLLI